MIPYYMINTLLMIRISIEKKKQIVSFVNMANVNRVGFRSLGAAIYCTYTGGGCSSGSLVGGRAVFLINTQI